MGLGWRGGCRSERVAQGIYLSNAALLAVPVVAFHIWVAQWLNVRETFWHTGAADYGILARSLVMGRGLSLDGETLTAFRTPLYPLFLATLLRLSRDARVVASAQSVVAGLTVAALVQMVTLSTRNYRLGLVVILQLVLLPDVLLENLVPRETVLFTLLLSLSGLIFVTEEQTHRWWKVIALGGCMGLACLTRPIAAVGPFLAVGWGWRLRRRGTAPSEIAQRLLVFAACFYLVLLPWGVRNAVCLGRFTVASTTMGLNLWKGNNPATASIYPWLDLDMLDELAAGNLPAGSGWWDGLDGVSDLDEIERDVVLRRLALAYIFEDPLRFLRMGFVKLNALWSPRFFPRGLGTVEWTPTGARITVGYLGRSCWQCYLILYSFVLVGLWRVRNHALGWLLLMWVVFYTIAHFVTFGETRFRLPVNMLSLPVAAIGLAWVIGAIKRGFRALCCAPRPSRRYRGPAQAGMREDDHSGR